MNSSFIPLFALAALAGCATAEPNSRAVITGEASYRERIAMRPGTRFEAVLEDVSRADAPSIQLGNFVIENAGNPPYRFTIAYNPTEIKAGHQYVVRATLRNSGLLMFTSNTHLPVITNGKDSEIMVPMVSVAPPHP